ncbi:MAG TPA: alcohol dehydrogenase, partial [Planctomycetaceae bacterium]|nr:alcohol dehydrogenase [Planctomycetaceae bacterium]
EILWQYTWPTDGSRVLQPYVDGDSVILTTYFGLGSRRVRVTHTDGVWGTSVEWESKDFKPYFNDFVVHDGYAYGFDINLFCCLDLKTGKRTWKKGRYGYGQVLLIADQNLLLVLSETGEAVLLKADPKQHVELGRFQAIEGKTWNHPVIVRGKLYVRNAEEMACYDVAPAERVADATEP